MPTQMLASGSNLQLQPGLLSGTQYAIVGKYIHKQLSNWQRHYTQEGSF